MSSKLQPVTNRALRVRQPFAEQIMRRVERLFTCAEHLEARYQSASKHVERLTPSLPAKAFRGELVEQEEGDESAEELVERIQLSREVGTVSSSGMKK